MLLAKGAQVNAKTKDGKTPLMVAADKGNAEVAQALLAKGADATLKDAKGKTALDMAADAHQASAGELLLRAAAAVPAAAPVKTP